MVRRRAKVPDQHDAKAFWQWEYCFRREHRFPFRIRDAPASINGEQIIMASPKLFLIAAGNEEVRFRDVDIDLKPWILVNRFPDSRVHDIVVPELAVVIVGNFERPCVPVSGMNDPTSTPSDVS